VGFVPELVFEEVIDVVGIGIEPRVRRIVRIESVVVLPNVRHPVVVGIGR